MTHKRVSRPGEIFYINSLPLKVEEIIRREAKSFNMSPSNFVRAVLCEFVENNFHYMDKED